MDTAHPRPTDPDTPPTRPAGLLRRCLRMPIGVQSILAVGLGALIGTLAPSAGEQLKILGDVFLNMVQVVVLPLVFPLIVLGIARMESVKKVGRIAGKAILYFEIVTTVVLLIAVGLAKFTGIGKGAPVHGADAGDLDGLSQGIDFHELVLHAFPKNIFEAFGEGNLLGAIVFALLVGVAMAAIGEKSEPFASVLESVASVMFKVVGYVIRIAPLGVLGFISYDVAYYGFGNLRSLLGFIAVVYAGLAVVVGVLFPLIAMLYRIRYAELLKSIAGLAGIAFVTRSSESVLAPLMGKLEAFGISRSTTSFVVPLGYSFNTDGSVLYQAAALVFLANAYGADTSLPALLLMVGVLVILSKGMAGVASASIVVLIAAGNSIGLPAEGVALLLGVDFIVDMARTGVNVIGNSLAAAVVDSSEKRRDAKHRARQTATAPTGSDPAPAGSDLAPAGSAPAPAGSDLAPAGSGPAPAGSDLAPAGSGPAPAGSDLAPAGCDPVPAGSGHAPAASDLAPAASGHAPAGSDLALAGCDPAPAASDLVPAGSDLAPAGSDPALPVSDPVPAASDHAPAGSDPAPAASDAAAGAAAAASLRKEPAQ
ncbi:cation:dicarboxylate symporter family transporter [Streptomyces massasporeus]